MHDGEGFFLMGSIILFMRVHLSGGECDRLRSLALILHKDSSYCKVRSIGGYSERQVRVRDAEDWGANHSFLEVFEGFHCLRSPDEGDIFVCEVSHGCCNL